MKTNIKIIIAFVLGLIISGVGVYAITSISADQINYDQNTTVKDKIDGLYTQVDNSILTSMSIKLRADSLTTSAASYAMVYLSSFSYYKHFKITNLTSNSSVTSDIMMRGHSLAQNKNIDNLSLNTQYNVLDSTDGYNFDILILTCRTNTNNSNAACVADITFYK